MSGSHNLPRKIHVKVTAHIVLSTTGAPDVDGPSYSCGLVVFLFT